MPSKVTKDIIRQFKLHFQNAEVRIPLALRQESPDIVFHSLIEDDAGPMENPGPMIGYEPMGDMGMAESGGDLASSLLGAATGQEASPGMPMAPMPLSAPQETQAAPQRPQGAPQQAEGQRQGPALPPDAEEILGML